MGIGSTSFPASLDTADDLVRATNNASTQLSGSINNSTTSIGVNSTASFPSSGIIRINDEIISYTGLSGGNTFTGCSRGFEGTTASSHQNNNNVFLDITAASNNVKNDAIIAVETKLGTGSSTPSANTVLRGTGTGTTAYGAVVNGDVASNAAIDHSKLAGMTAGQVLIGNASNVPTSTSITGDVTITSSGVTAIGSGVIVNADVNASAAIDHSKLASITAGNILLGNASNVPTSTAVTGDVTITSGGVTAIASGVIVNADVSASAAIDKTKISGTAITAADTGTVTPAMMTATAQALSFRNILINGAMQISQRYGTTNTSTADDAYALDRWYVLTQTAAIQVQQQSDQENGTPFNSRLTQNQATAQRMGYAQIIEGKNCKYLRGQTVTLSFRLRCSASQAIRYAILEWTGTEDSVTSDVVNSWTNTTYTTGNFFISTTTTIPTNGVTSITPSANTWTDATALTVTLGTSFNNLTVFVWTEGTAAQNVTLDVSRVQLEPGSTATAFEYLPIDVQLARCQRYYWRQTGPLPFSYMSAFAPASSTTAGIALVTFPVQMRRDPIVVETSNLHLTDLFSANFTFTATDINTTVPNNAGPRMLVLGLTGASGLTQGRMYALRCNDNAAGFLGVSAEL